MWHKNHWPMCVCIVAALFPAPIVSISAQDVSPVALSADLDHRARYLFAGMPFSTGPVIQGTVRIGYDGWTFNAFANYDADLTEINEGDVWGDYYHQFNDVVGGFVGGALYNFRIAGEWELTPEVYGGLVLALPGTPTLYYARDFDLTTGDHAALTLSHGLPVGNARIEATGRVEYNNGYYREGSSFSYTDLNVALPVALGPLTITPMVSFVGALADDFESRVVGGLNAHIAIR